MKATAWPPASAGTRWLFRLPNWIGDAVMVLPAIRALPAVGQRWIGVSHPRVIEIYRSLGVFAELWEARGARSPLELGWQARGFRPQRAVVFTEAPSGAILARLSGARLRAGRTRGALCRLLTQPVPPADRRSPLWRQYLELVEVAGAPSVARPDFHIDPGPQAMNTARQLLTKPSEPVAVAPGATFGPAKRWPLSRFVDLCRRLVERGETVLALGGPGERELGRELAQAGALDLTGKTSLLEGVAVLRRTRALITNDSGALHLGRAAGTPVVAVFGSSLPAWTGPSPEEGIVLRRDLPCSPCFRRRCPLTGADHLRCLNEISVDQVLEALDHGLGVGA